MAVLGGEGSTSSRKERSTLTSAEREKQATEEVEAAFDKAQANKRKAQLNLKASFKRHVQAYEAFCHAQHDAAAATGGGASSDDVTRVTPLKLLTFLKHESDRLNKDNRSAQRIGFSALDQATTALKQLWQTQNQALGLTDEQAGGTPRSGPVSQFIAQHRTAQQYRAREDGTGAKRTYTEAQLMELIRHCLRSGNFVGLRTVTAQLLSHRMLMRSDFVPKVELSDFGVEQMDVGGGRRVPYLTIATRESKIDPANTLLYTGALRHKHPLLCSIFAVALLLFHRFHCEFEDLPSYFVDKEWYHIKLMVSARTEPSKQREADDEAAADASDDVRMHDADSSRMTGVEGAGVDDSRMEEDDDEDENEDEEVVPIPKPSRPLTRVETELTRNAHHKKLTGIFKAAVTDDATGLAKLSIYGRDAGTREAQDKGCSAIDIFRLAGWKQNAGVLDQSLAPGLPHDVLKVLAGFEASNEAITYPRDIAVPDELSKQIFPFVEVLEESIRTGTVPSNGGALGFARAMRWFRSILCQDLPSLAQLCPTHPIVRHPIFQSPAYKAFQLKLPAPTPLQAAAPVPQPQAAPPAPQASSSRAAAPLAAQQLSTVVSQGHAQQQSLLGKIDALHTQLGDRPELQARVEAHKQTTNAMLQAQAQLTNALLQVFTQTNDALLAAHNQLASAALPGPALAPTAPPAPVLPPSLASSSRLPAAPAPPAQNDSASGTPIRSLSGALGYKESSGPSRPTWSPTALGAPSTPASSSATPIAPSSLARGTPGPIFNSSNVTAAALAAAAAANAAAARSSASTSTSTPAGPSGSTSSTVARPRSSESPAAAQRPRTVNAHVVTVQQLWQEWTEGFDGGPSIRQLVEHQGKRWCADRSEERCIQRRQPIINLLTETPPELRQAKIAELEIMRRDRSFPALARLLVANAAVAPGGAPAPGSTS